MERAMSVEEKIRRAEEIYERRKRGNVRQVATVSVSDKKDLKLLKKLLVQVLICSFIYTVIYTISKNDYPFSKDFIGKANQILSYDTNFSQIYENIKNTVNGWMNKIEENTSQEESIGGAEENNTDEQTNTEEQQIADTQKEEDVQPLTQEEQDIINVKNTTTFIKPVEGSISSKYGPRPNATGTVPKNHTGTDIAANLGTKIKAATDGEVVLSSSEGDYR